MSYARRMMDIPRLSAALASSGGTPTPLGTGEKAWFGVRGRRTLLLESTAGGVRVSYRPADRGPRRVLLVTDASPVAELSDAVREWGERLAAEELAIGKRYRVLQPFLGYVAGDEVECVGAVLDPHASAWIWSFRRADGKAVDLTELADAHVPILRDLDLYLGAA